MRRQDFLRQGKLSDRGRFWQYHHNIIFPRSEIKSCGVVPFLYIKMMKRRTHQACSSKHVIRKDLFFVLDKVELFKSSRGECSFYPSWLCSCVRWHLGTKMKIMHFCFFCASPAISNLISMLLFAFILASSKFKNLFAFNLGTNLNMYIFVLLIISNFFLILLSYI